MKWTKIIGQSMTGLGLAILMACSGWPFRHFKKKQSVNLQPATQTRAEPGLQHAPKADSKHSSESSPTLSQEKRTERDIWYRKGRMFFNHGQYTQGLDAFQQAIQLDRAHVGAHLYSAKTHLVLLAADSKTISHINRGKQHLAALQGSALTAQERSLFVDLVQLFKNAEKEFLENINHP